MRKALLAILMLSLGASAWAQGGSGQGGGKGKRAGAGRACQEEFVVVRTDGTRERHPSAEALLEGLTATPISQGENPRAAVKAEVLLKKYGADWVEALACDNHSVQIPSGLAVEGQEYFVLTGRGGVKAVREIKAGSYRNTITDIRKLTFHVRDVRRSGGN